MELISYSDLCTWLGFDVNLTKPSTVRAFLEENGVRYFTRKDGRPVTTSGALHEALSGGNLSTPEPDWGDLDGKESTRPGT